MEASFAQIHRHFSSRNLLGDRNRSNIKPFVRSLSYGRRKSFRLSVSMHLEGTNMESPGREAKTATSFTTDIPKQHMEAAEKSYPSSDQVNGNLGTDASGRVDAIVQPKKSAKIHDFCFGIPFGGLVLSGGFVSFLFSRNPATLTSGVLYGGALLALSSYSLKVWRQGKSSLPFILGQAALAAALLWKHLQMYTLTKKLFPTGFLTVVSAAMLCFYTYVMMSGGNPPPKKLKLATNSPS